MSILTIQEAFPNESQEWLNGLEKEFRWGVELEKVRYKARQLEARKREGTNHRNVDGLGQLTHVFDARTYFRWMEEDEHFWEDDNNVRRFEQDNPECKADAPEKNIRITV